MADPLLEARIRAHRYWYRDGLSEIPLGIVQLLMSGSGFIGTLGNRTSSWFVPVYLIYTVLFVALAVFASRIMAAVRERITYPRSGYMRPRLSGWKRHALMLAAVTGALVAGGPALRRPRGRLRSGSLGTVATSCGRPDDRRGRGVRDCALRFATVSRGGRTRHHPRCCGVHRVSPQGWRWQSGSLAPAARGCGPEGLHSATTSAPRRPLRTRHEQPPPSNCGP
jgi:hypothetical protein